MDVYGLATPGVIMLLLCSPALAATSVHVGDPLPGKFWLPVIWRKMFSWGLKEGAVLKLDQAAPLYFNTL